MNKNSECQQTSTELTSNCSPLAHIISHPLHGCWSNIGIDNFFPRKSIDTSTLVIPFNIRGLICNLAMESNLKSVRKR